MEEAPSPIRPLTHPSCSLGNCDGVGLPRALGRADRLGEMVEADADVACLGDPLRGRLELREALGGSWQRILGQERLMPLHPGHVGVAEAGDPLGVEFEGARHRRNDVLDGLERQAVHEIEVERPDPGVAQPLCDAARLRRIGCVRSSAARRVRSSGRPGLPGSRSPPSAPRYGLERSSEGRSRRRSRRRPRCRGARQPDASGAGSPNLSGSSESASPMDVTHVERHAQRLRNEVDFALQEIDVGLHRPIPPRQHRGVAPAIEAEFGAERDMKVERRRRSRGQFSQPGREGLGPDRRRKCGAVG